MAHDRVSNKGGKYEYWLHADSKEAIEHLQSNHVRWSLWNTSPVRMSWVRNFCAYYSAMINPSSWDTNYVWAGTQGELIKMYTPKARSLMRQLITLLTKQRLAFQAQAQSSGMDILNDVKLANAIMDQIVDIEDLNRKTEDLLENAFVFGTSFFKISWRTDMGEPFMVDDGRIIYTGRPTVDVYNPLDVFFDIDIASWDRQDWVEVRTIKNRWSLIAEHPELEDDLRALPSWYDERGPNYWFDQQNVTNHDLVAIYECYAKKTPALPNGRLIVYGSSDCVIYDGDNIYDCIPIEQYLPERIQGTSLGYAKINDIMALQEILDNSISSIATNQAAFAVQNITIPRGANINVQELGGLRYISFTPMDVQGGGKPEPLQLTSSPAETFKFIDLVDKKMDDLSGVHPIMRGESKNVTSGAMAATMTANAIEFLDSASKGLFITLEKTMMHVVNSVKQHAKIPQKVTMKGKSNQVYQKEFVGDDLKKISGVKILVSNPMLQTTAGRLEIAQQMMQIPPQMWPEWVGILDGKPLESLTRGALSQSDLVYMENESLMSGQETPTLITDDHAYHIQKHSELLNDPEIRRESDKLQIIMDHIIGHQQLMREADPELMSIIKTGTTPPPQANMGQVEQLETPPDMGLPNEITKEATPAPDPLGRPTNR